MADVALLTVINKNYAAIGDITMPNMQSYCDRHGYDFHVGHYNTDPEHLENYGDRGKIGVYTSLFNDYPIIMFLDVDALIMNSAIRIPDVLFERVFLWTYHVDGPCSGFWIARRDPAVHLALNSVKSRAPLVGNVRTVLSPGPPSKVLLEMEPTGQSDQEVMTSLMHRPPYNAVFGNQNCVSGKEAGHCFDYREVGWPPIYDSIGNYEPGDWILTFPGAAYERRVELLREAAKKAT